MYHSDLKRIKLGLCSENMKVRYAKINEIIERAKEHSDSVKNKPYNDNSMYLSTNNVYRVLNQDLSNEFVDKCKYESWSKISPSKGSERDLLMNKCGSKCFLSPSNKGFPICPKLGSTDKDCIISCQGLKAAKNRASQWKHKEVLERSVELTDNLCN
jgi:hypothetical protein